MKSDGQPPGFLHKEEDNSRPPPAGEPGRFGSNLRIETHSNDREAIKIGKQAVIQISGSLAIEIVFHYLEYLDFWELTCELLQLSTQIKTTV